MAIAAAPPSLRFFAAAAAWAAFGVPLWLATWAGHLPSCRACDPVAQHGHEMLSGYAFAVVAGFLATRIPGSAIGGMLLLWLAARVATALDAPLLAAPASIGFAIALFVGAGMPFLKAAKTPQNLVFAPLIGLFTVADALYWAGAAGMIDGGGRGAVQLGLALIALLLFLMGGRITPVATAGALRKRGVDMGRGAAPAAEWAGIAGLAVLAAGQAAGLAAPAGIGALAAGAAALFRLSLWRPGALPDQPEIWSLQLGYGWLGVGLLLQAAGLFGLLPPAAGAHALGVGALGTLAYAMMIRASRQRTGRPVRLTPALTGGVLLVSAAAALRIAGIAAPWLMAPAALCWGVAHAVLAVDLIRSITPRRRSAAAQGAG